MANTVQLNTVAKETTDSICTKALQTFCTNIINPERENKFSEESLPKSIPGDDCEISFTDEIEDPKALISVLTTLLFSKGNISVIGGKAKARKTFFLSMVIAAFLTRQYGNMTAGDDATGNVLVFDTEQGKSHVYKVLRRIYQMCQYDKPDNRIRMYYLRELSISDRIAAIEAQIEKHRPTLVVIDGVVDICRNFNEIEASTETTQLLMRLSSEYNCHICCVLHENKSDGNLRGHLGSILTQKCETVIQLQKDGAVTLVSAAYTRGIPFDDFYFGVTIDGLPYVTKDGIEKKETQTDTMVRIARQILDGEAMEYTTLKEMYCEFAGKAESTTKKHIAQLLSMGIIYKDNNDQKYRCTKFR